MASSKNVLRVLVIDDDDRLAVEIQAMAYPAVAFDTIAPAAASSTKRAFTDRHVVVVGVDMQGGLDLVADLCSRPGMPPVIALGSSGWRGKSLEHILTLAELRGAALALPKPIDAIELALHAVELVRCRAPAAADLSHIAMDLERRLAC